MANRSILIDRIVTACECEFMVSLDSWFLALSLYLLGQPSFILFFLSYMCTLNIVHTPVYLAPRFLFGVCVMNPCTG